MAKDKTTDTALSPEAIAAVERVQALAASHGRELTFSEAVEASCNATVQSALVAIHGGRQA